MSTTPAIVVGKRPDGHELQLLPAMANRHGLVAGATGTGKTVTLQALAEAFSRIGVPVFAADVKGDLAGISQPGGGNAKIEARAQELGLGALQYAGCPVVLWDVFGELGQPVRATVSEMGPLLLGRLLDLNDTQTRRPQPRVQGRRRRGPAAARPEGPARHARGRRRPARRSSAPGTDACRRRASVRSSVAC